MSTALIAYLSVAVGAAFGYAIAAIMAAGKNDDFASFGTGMPPGEKAEGNAAGIFEEGEHPPCNQPGPGGTIQCGFAAAPLCSVVSRLSLRSRKPQRVSQSLANRWGANVRGNVMGMDVYGMSPTGEEGRYFRSTAGAWHPLVDCIRHFAPEIAAKCKSWDYNDGDGLGAADSIALADKLQAEIDAGKVTEFASHYAGAPPPYLMQAMAFLRNDGNELVAEPGYSLSIEHLQNLVRFLRSCGGFRIL